jgi:hypothetical protein
MTLQSWTEVAGFSYYVVLTIKKDWKSKPESREMAL